MSWPSEHCIPQSIIEISFTTMSTATKELHLSLMDQPIFRQYIRHLLIFPFPDNLYADNALYALRQRLSLTLQQHSFLARTVKVLDLTTGILKASYPDPIRPDYGDVMLTASFAVAANSKYDLSYPRRSRPPTSYVACALFCPIGLRNHAGLEDPHAENCASAAKDTVCPSCAHKRRSYQEVWY